MSAGWSYAGIIVGAAGAGKTTLARREVERHLLSSSSAIVLAHDPVRQYTGGARYQDAAAARAAISAAAAQRSSLPRLMSIGGASEDVTALALEIGERRNSASRQTVPILVVYDEASLLSSSGPTWISRRDNEALAIRRHRGVGSLYAVQRPAQLPAPFWDLSTHCYCFAAPSTTARRLEEIYLLEPGALDRVRSLRRYEFVRIVPGGLA